MKRILTPLIFLALLLAACGDNVNEVGTSSQSDGPAPVGSDVPIPVEPDGGIGDGGEPLPDLPLGDDSPVDEEVITDNEPVDPKVTTPEAVVVNPDNPNELWVRFVGGAAPCTAAEVVLTETADAVNVELLVGITADALMKSCLAGTFNLRVDAELSEPLGDRAITWTEAGPAAPQAITPDLTVDDFIGLTEAEASALAEENMITWRVVRIDDENMMVTMDYSPSRLNFEIDEGVITVVTFG